MPFPAARITLPNVDSTRGPRSGHAACADTQVSRLLRRCKSPNRPLRARHLQRIRCPNLCSVPAPTTTTPPSRQVYGHRPRQRQIPPCDSVEAVTAQIPQNTASAVSTTIQPTTRAHRARLETRTTDGHAQPVLRYARRRAPSSQCVLPTLAEAQPGIAPLMLHYLRRCV